MPLVVERSFEAASNIMAGAVCHCCHRLGRSQASASGTANEEEVLVHLYAERPQLIPKVFSKAWVHALIRKGLPFDENGAFAYRTEIGDPDVGRFARVRTSINCERGRKAEFFHVASTLTASTTLSPFSTLRFRPQCPFQ